MPQTKPLKSFPISIGSLENSYKTVFVDKDPTEIEVKIGKVRIRDLEVVDFLAGDIEVSSATMNDCTINDDLTVGDNIFLPSDSALISFGADGQDMFLQSDNNGFIIQAQADETNTLNNSLTLQTKSSGTTAVGFGGAINMQLQNSSGNQSDGVQIGAKYTGVIGGNENVSLVVSNESSGTLTERMVLTHQGNLSVGGTITDGSGNVLGSGGGGASALNDLSDVSYSSGDLTITSLDKIVADDFVIDSGASIELDSHNGNFVAKKAGTEFSSANSAYAGMILGYTCLRNDGSTGDSITIGTSMTVLQTSAGNDVKVTFKAPPSGNVEIEFSACVRGTSKTVRCALSDNATFNEVADFHTYDNKCITMDETDSYYNNIKWFVSGLTAGDEYTYYIGAKSSSASSFIDHGENRFALHSAPIIVKCTALPGTIFTGE